MTHVLAFLAGMAVLPTVRGLYELGSHLREMWRHLRWYEGQNKRHPLPRLGRFLLRIMRVLKGSRASDAETDFARKLRLGECICGGPNVQGMHDSTCPQEPRMKSGGAP